MIKIIHGVYGHVDKMGIVRPKTEADPPFSLTPEQEARLVQLGVAAYVGNAPVEEEPLDIGEISVEDVSLSERSVKELREIGKEYGLTFKVGASKADMVKAIEAAEDALVADDEDEDDESAPAFDAAEAVQ